jgi:hypothetical protein
MHILHNAAKHGLKLLSFDVEMLVMKVFNEFSSSAKKIDELKDFFLFFCNLSVLFFFVTFLPASSVCLLLWTDYFKTGQ